MRRVFPILGLAVLCAACSDHTPAARNPIGIEEESGSDAGEAGAAETTGASTGASGAGGSPEAGRGGAGARSAGAGGRGGEAGASGNAGSDSSAGAAGMPRGGAGGENPNRAGQMAPPPPPPPTSDAPNLNIYSDTSSIEFTPALLAARSFYPGKASVNTGGIADLFSGRADLATNAETQALRQSAQHPELRIIFTVTETFYRIVAKRSAGINQLSDLKGKRVATVPNTSAHYYLDLMLRTAGLTAMNVTVVSAFPLSRMPDMLVNGQADAATSWEPEPQNAFDRLGMDAIEFQDRAVYREIVNLHATEATLANPEKRKGVVAFVRALMDATKKYRDAPAEVWPLVADATGYEPALIEKIWHNEQFAGTLAPDLLDVLEREEPWVAQQSNRAARSRAELTQLVDDSVLREAMDGR